MYRLDYALHQPVYSSFGIHKLTIYNCEDIKLKTFIRFVVLNLFVKQKMKISHSQSDSGCGAQFVLVVHCLFFAHSFHLKGKSRKVLKLHHVLGVPITN